MSYTIDWLLTWKWHWDDNPADFQSAAPWRAVPASPGNWVEMQIIGPPPPAGSKTVGLGPDNLNFHKPPSDPDECWSFRPPIQANPLNLTEKETEHWRTCHQDWNKISQFQVQFFVQKFSFLSFISSSGLLFVLLFFLSIWIVLLFFLSI